MTNGDTEQGPLVARSLYACVTRELATGGPHGGWQPTAR
jgi:hypothetical protein